MAGIVQMIWIMSLCGALHSLHLGGDDGVQGDCGGEKEEGVDHLDRPLYGVLGQPWVSQYSRRLDMDSTFSHATGQLSLRLLLF